MKLQRLLSLTRQAVDDYALVTKLPLASPAARTV